MKPFVLLALAMCATCVAAAQPNVGALEALQAEAVVRRAAIAQAAPWIVRIDTVGGAQPVEAPSLQQALRGTTGPGFIQADGPTTGVLWSSDGYVVTSSFNFARDPSVIIVTLSDGRQVVGELVARDYVARLALVKISVEQMATPTPTPAPRDELRAGRFVLALGMGHGASQPTTTVGVISALSRMSGLALQTDAKTSPANYGGPLIDLRGRLVGVITPMGQTSGDLAGVEWYDSGIGFALDADLVAERVELLKRGGDLRPGVLGALLDMTPPIVGEPAPDGVEVLGVHEPASDAGLLEGDLIVALDDRPVDRPLDLLRRLARRVAGDDVKLTVERGDEMVPITIRLAAPETPSAKLEMHPSDETPATD